MRRRTRDFGHLKLIFAFLFISIVIPNILNALNSSATGNLGSFETGETGIKLCAQIDAGPADSLRFFVTNNQGFSADVLVDNDSCKSIKTVAATYTIREYLPQEYVLDSVSGGTVSADNTPFVATATGQYSIIYSNEYDQKGYLHSFGYTLSNQAASAVDVHFDANGGTGSMQTQRFGLNSQQPLTANTFTMTDYNFTGWNTKADGTGTPYTDEQQISFATGGELTLFAQWRDPNLYRNIINRSNNGVDTNVDFTTAATIANGNGNGLNIRAGTENDQYPIYYFRGQLSDNHVIWADKCWKVVRTTETGGIKMIYNGFPTLVNGVQQCNATGVDSQITVNVNGADQNAFTFSDQGRYNSPADVGYMYGSRIAKSALYAGTITFTFSNDVSRSGNVYTLDTSSGQSISGTWEDERLNAAARYHYFCTDGTAICDNTKIGYIHAFNDSSYISYLKVDGYDDIEDMKNAMFANTTDSNAKAMVETWFEQQNLDGHILDTRNYEDDLEDTVFCNDRSYYGGALKDKDSEAKVSYYSYHSSYGRNFIKNSENNYEPNLNCANSNDAFTKDSANGNGKLKHKIGLITADELTVAGNGIVSDYSNTVYLNTGQTAWSLSPYYFSDYVASESDWYERLAGNYVNTMVGLRPLVSLKTNIEFVSGTGLQTDPYIVE